MLLFGSFWLLFGLPFLGFGVAAGFQEIYEGVKLRDHGQAAQGVVLEKRRGFNTGRQSAGPGIRYAFRTSGGSELEQWASLEGAAWSRLRVGGPVGVTYLPEAPEIHRVDGRESDVLLAALLSFMGLVFTAIGGGIVAYNLRTRRRR